MRKVTEIQHEYSYKAVEKLDELITTGIICVEQECMNDMRLPWSEEIHEKITQVNRLRLYMSSLQNKVDRMDQIEKKQHTLKVKQDLPTTVKKTTELLKAAQKKDKKCGRISIQKTILLEDQGEAYIASRPNMCPLRAARIFKNFKDSNGIYSELPTK